MRVGGALGSLGALAVVALLGAIVYFASPTKKEEEEEENKDAGKHRKLDDKRQEIPPVQRKEKEKKGPRGAVKNKEDKHATVKIVEEIAPSVSEHKLKKYPQYKHVKENVAHPPVTLRIFDFDGTLFASPMPSKNLWDPSLFGKIRGTPFEGGLGWFQDVVTLQAPYVPKEPTPEWYNQSLIEIIEKSKGDESIKNVLLTGRLEAYRPCIESIVGHIGLAFHETTLKPDPSRATLTFKLEYLVSLLEKFKPSRIEIWEDRPKHSAQFEEYFNWVGIDCQVVLVDAMERTLPEEMEIEVVETLIAKYQPGALLEPVVSFTGVMLDEESRAKLLENFPVPADWTVKADHMTIKLGPLEPEEQDRLGLHIGDQVKLKVTGFGKSDKAMAVRVEGAKSYNAIPHITLGVSPIGKAKDSNAITDWVDFEGDIILSGTVKERKTMRLKIKKREPSKGPKVNIGKMVSSLHPQLKGKAIGNAVQQVMAWLKENDIDNVEQNAQQMEEYVKSTSFE